MHWSPPPGCGNSLMPPFWIWPIFLVGRLKTARRSISHHARGGTAFGNAAGRVQQKKAAKLAFPVIALCFATHARIEIILRRDAKRKSRHIFCPGRAPNQEACRNKKNIGIMCDSPSVLIREPGSDLLLVNGQSQLRRRWRSWFARRSFRQPSGLR